MSETKAIAGAARALRDSGEPFLLATVVAVRGSSYRRPGARLIIADDRRVAGSVSGGCLEQELIQRGWWHTRETGTALLSFDSRTGQETDEGARDPHSRTGCGGVVEILLERVSPGAASNPLTLVETAVTEETELAMLTVYRSSRLDAPVGARRVIPADGGRVPVSAAVTAATPAPMAALMPALIERARRALAETDRAYANVTIDLPDGRVQALAERLRPPPHLFVFGAGLDALPVVGMAAMLGWTCTVWDPQARAGSRARFAAADHVRSGDLAAVRARVDASARPLAVVMSHNLENDRRALAMLLPSRALYVGVLGPWRRTERLLAGVDGDGARALRDGRGRLHAPVGLRIGAETADEIALSIMAQAQAVLAGTAATRAAAPVVRRAPALHAPPGRKAGAPRALREVAP